MAMNLPRAGRTKFKPMAKPMPKLMTKPKTMTKTSPKPKPTPSPTKPPKATNAQIAAAAIKKAAAAKKRKAAGPVGTGAQGVSGYRGTVKSKPKLKPTMRPRKMPSEAQLLKEWNESAGGKRAGGSFNDFILRKRKEYGYKNQFDY